MWKLHLNVTCKAKTKSEHKLLHWISPCSEVQENPVQKNSCNILVCGVLDEFPDIKSLRPLQRSKKSSHVISRLTVSVVIRISGIILLMFRVAHAGIFFQWSKHKKKNFIKKKEFTVIFKNLWLMPFLLCLIHGLWRPGRPRTVCEGKLSKAKLLSVY